MKRRKQEEQKLSILLKTLVNGYMLEVNNEDYMYFDAQSLLEGFCIHVGMERVEAMTKEEIQDMLKAFKEGGLVKKQQAEVNELQAEIVGYKNLIREQKREIRKLSENG